MYGITEADKKKIDEKIESQKEFLKTFGYKSMGANISPKKYFAELNNRVNALVDVAFAQRLKPVFLTITLPSWYHPSSDMYRGYTVTESKNKLAEIWRKILQNTLMKKNKYYFIKVFEPHKSGVPHLHILLFLNPDFIETFKNMFARYMKRNNILQYEVKTSFQSRYGVRSVVAYIMKYLNKTFKNAKKGVMDLISYWYVKHRIIRVTMSRIFVSLSFYRKVRYRKEFRDLKYLTKLYKNNAIGYSYHKTYIEYRYVGEIEVVQEDVWYKPRVKVIKWRLGKKVKELKVPVYNEDVYIGSMVDGVFKRRENYYPALMGDYMLLDYYYSLNPDDENISLLHYGITQNECIRRGLINGEIQSLNDFNLDFDFG